MGDAIFLSLSGEGRRLRERADASVSEVAAAAGIDVLTLLRSETGELDLAGPHSGDWACVVRVRGGATWYVQRPGGSRHLTVEVESNTSAM